MAESSSVIISNPNSQTRFQRTLFGALTVALWALWIYLWLPVLTGVFWIIGIRAAYREIFGGPRGISLASLGWVLLIATAAVTYWSAYNMIRYGQSTRRSRTREVSKKAVAESFGIVDTNTVALLVEQRSLEFRFAESGQISLIKARE